MKRTIFFTLICFSITNMLIAQKGLDKSTFRMEYTATERIENQYDTLVQVNIILDVAQMGELSKILVSGGTRAGLSNRVNETLDVNDEGLAESNKIELLDDHTVKINMGVFNLAKEMIYFDVKLQDTKGNVSTSLARLKPEYK